ncbi:MAG: T9SS type A sorting domain-containing protein [Candidatus Kapabacteria bacterium]|nr:T9SS type A sorting domain-containing protein [Candidatus Kapabacteria bacterium]
MKIKAVLLIIIIFPVLVQAQSGKWEVIDTLRFIQPGHQYPWEMNYIKIEKRGNTICAFGNMSRQYPWNRVSWDNGKTWSSTLMDSARYNPDDSYRPGIINSVSFPNENFCIISTDSAYFWISKNKLKSWEKKTIKSGESIYHIKFLNDNVGYGLRKKKLMITKDGGNNWHEKEIVSPDSLSDFSVNDMVVFPDKIILLIYLPKNKTKYTFISTNDGETWNYYYSDTLKFQKVFFLDKNNGWGCGGHQTQQDSPVLRDVIVHTTDGGKTWQRQLDTLVIPPMGLNQVYFVDKENGFAHGQGRKLWRTTDGGKQWIRDTSFNSRNIPWPTIDIAPVSQDLIYACSEYIGLTYKYSESTSVVPDIKQSLLPVLSVSPNPAKDYIEIIYSIGTGLSLAYTDEINIYNILGECVLSEKIHQITQSYRMNIEHLPSGIYYVRLGDWVGRFVKIE